MTARATIGQLIVSLGANTGPFEKGMGRAKKQLSSVQKKSKSVNKTLGALKGTLAGFGAGLAISKVVSSFTDLADSADRLAKMSRNLGLTTQELGALEFAAERSGIGAEAMTTGLERMTRRIGDAAQGTGEAKDALREMGLSAERLNNMSPWEAFLKISDALGNVTNQGDKIRLVYDLFGRDSAKFLDLIGSGSENVMQLREEFEKLGGAISPEEAATFERFNDAITNLKAAAGASFRDFAVTVSPQVLAVVKQLERMFLELTRLRDPETYLKRNRKKGFTAENIIGGIGSAIEGARSIYRRERDSLKRGAQNLRAAMQLFTVVDPDAEKRPKYVPRNPGEYGGGPRRRTSVFGKPGDVVKELKEIQQILRGSGYTPTEGDSVDIDVVFEGI